MIILNFHVCFLNKNTNVVHEEEEVEKNMYI